MEKKLRSIEVNMGIPDIKFGSKGFFHSWCREPFYNTEGSHYLTKTYALVEFMDGSIKLLEPEAIRFIEPYTPKKTK
ncbi:MAG TPA: hypothetical protein PK185_11865 [Cyclobacteriaceae bacterium]|nr:hypothetical protein [Cyclobacteriaceae bacterium]